MKHIVATALSAAAVVGVMAGCIAVIAGWDDIRRLRRMRNM